MHPYYCQGIKTAPSKRYRWDIVLDPFCGCATTCIAAELCHWDWIGIDISKKAYELVNQRLEKEVPSDLVRSIIFRTDIPQRTGDKAPKDIKHQLFGKQEGLCAGCSHHFPFRNFTLDHIVPRSHGGGDAAGNLQLLCGACNSSKGNRSMEYLLAKLKQDGIRQL